MIMIECYVLSQYKAEKSKRDRIMNRKVILRPLRKWLTFNQMDEKY